MFSWIGFGICTFIAAISGCDAFWAPSKENAWWETSIFAGGLIGAVAILISKVV